MADVIVGFFSCLVMTLFVIACCYDLKVNLTTLRNVKKLEDRVTAIEEGRESDVNN